MLGASIVGAVGAAVALTVLVLGAQTGSDSGADAVLGAGPSANTAAAPVPGDPVPAATLPPDTLARGWVPRETPAPDTLTHASRVAPETLFAFADPSTCPAAARAAVVDRENQRAWLCGDGLVTHEMPMTSAWIQPDPGDYAIYAKDKNSSSEFSGRYSTMTHFVAFSYGEIRGARIAFHSMPVYPDGSFVQPLETLGTPELRGDSAGCIRVSPADAELIWSWLEIDDLVRVIS